MFAKISACFLILLMGTGVATYSLQDEPVQRDTSKFMKRKLDAARDIISGLSTENFNQISQSAQDLMLLSHEADWNVIQTVPFLRLSSEFRTGAERLRDSAKEKNLDLATISFFEVTLSCVRCHKYVRQHPPK